MKVVQINPGTVTVTSHAFCERDFKSKVKKFNNKLKVTSSEHYCNAREGFVLQCSLSITKSVNS